MASETEGKKEGILTRHKPVKSPFCVVLKWRQFSFEEQVRSESKMNWKLSVSTNHRRLICFPFPRSSRFYVSLRLFRP